MLAAFLANCMVKAAASPAVSDLLAGLPASPRDQIYHDFLKGKSRLVKLFRLHQGQQFQLNASTGLTEDCTHYRLLPSRW
jgi:hypothetical protein